VRAIGNLLVLTLNHQSEYVLIGHFFGFIDCGLDLVSAVKPPEISRRHNPDRHLHAVQNAVGTVAERRFL
jgi:hypothetical protein